MRRQAPPRGFLSTFFCFIVFSSLHSTSSCRALSVISVLPPPGPLRSLPSLFLSNLSTVNCEADHAHSPGPSQKARRRKNSRLYRGRCRHNLVRRPRQPLRLLLPTRGMPLRHLQRRTRQKDYRPHRSPNLLRSEEHTSELQSLRHL